MSGFVVALMIGERKMNVGLRDANGHGGDMFLGVNDHGQAVGLSREMLVDIKASR